MNILQMEDMVKGLPDQILMQEAQAPSGQIPQFLALSEVQRRQEMRQRFQAPPEATVADQIIQGGIASAMPQQAPQQPPAAPQGMPMAQPQGMPQGQPPAMMYGGGVTPGGIVRMQQGQTIPDMTRSMMAQNLVSAGEQIPLTMDLISYVKTKLPTFDALPPDAKQEVLVRFDPMYQQARSRTQMVDRARTDPEAVLAELEKARVPPVVAAAAPVAADSSPAAGPTPAGVAPDTTATGVAPDVTVAGATAPADIVSERLDTSDQAGVLPEFKRGTPPEFLQSLLSRLGGGTSPEAQEAIDLRRSLIEQGLPAPIDLGQFIQAAEQRQLEAKEEAKRMALANVLTSLGVGLLEGDAAAGLQQATKLAGETLREGRKEARAEGQIAEQLRLQAAQQERQNIIDTMKFKSESVDAIANLISGERKANLTNSLQAAQLLVQFQNNQDNLAMELTKQGFSEQKINKELEKAALQSATRVVENLISSGQLEVSDPAEAGRLINQLANQFTGASNEEDLSSNSVDYASLVRKNQ